MHTSYSYGPIKPQYGIITVDRIHTNGDFFQDTKIIET